MSHIFNPTANLRTFSLKAFSPKALTALLLASVLTACGGGGSSSNNNSANSGNTNDNSANTGSGSNTPNGDAVEGMLFFASTPETDKELWISDGTTQGTRLLKDIFPGGVGQEPTDDFITINDKTFFFARDSRDADARYNKDLWVSNGTPNGTYSLQAGIGEGNIMTRVGDKIVFNARKDLWVSDGTADGTFILAEDIRPKYMFSAGDYVLFDGRDTASGSELWITDGTTAGTKLLKDINPGSDSSLPIGFTLLNNHVYFAARTEAHGKEMWKTDGTTAGTTLVNDLRTGASLLGNANSGVYSNTLVTAGDRLFFFGYNSSGSSDLSAASLWMSDGTAAGTTEIKQFSGVDNAGRNMLTAYGENVVFVVGKGFGLGDNRLWVSDGTEAGTMRLHDTMEMLVPRAGYYENYFAEVNGKLLFAGRDGSSGSELWQTDGTRAGTKLLKDINTAAGEPGVLSGFRTYKGDAYFTARYDTGKVGIYKTDATEAGTSLLVDTSPLVANGLAYQITSFKAPTGSSNNANDVFEE